MNRTWALITLPSLQSTALTHAHPISAPDAAFAPHKRQMKSAEKRYDSSPTGCIVEQDGHCVLVDGRPLTAIANLGADGFPREGFAKLMGHKVMVREISNSGSERPVVQVRHVEQICETCVPQHQ